MIEKYKKLCDEKIKNVRSVEQICKKYDGLKGDLYIDTSLNFNAEMNSAFLLYEGDKLVSFISLFIPTSAEAEVSAYTLPDYRRKGYFKRLLADAIDEAKKYTIKDLLFICEPHIETGGEVIKRMDAQYEFTEYSLVYKGFINDMKLREIPNFKLLKAKPEDLREIIELSCEVFDDGYDDSVSMVMKSFEAENRIQYITKLNEKIIGMGSVSFENDEASIYGLGIAKKYQGHGYGRQMIQLLINEIKDKGIKDIKIEVDSSNDSDFHLYKTCGFEVEASFDYYRKSVL